MLRNVIFRRHFSSASRLHEIKSVHGLPDRVLPNYSSSGLSSKLLYAKWPSGGPRNVLLIQKSSASVREAVVEFANYLHKEHPHINLILEPNVAGSIHQKLRLPVYSLPSTPAPSPFPYTRATDARTPSPYNAPTIRSHVPENNGPQEVESVTVDDSYHRKTDLLITMGGDGTILHAASLFATLQDVPPLLSFALGTLGFLGECRWSEFETAFEAAIGHGQDGPGSEKLRVLRRGRLKVGVFDGEGKRIGGDQWIGGNDGRLGDVHVMNEVNIHRGLAPHLAIVEVLINGKMLTEAVADGMIISTPTGSTAYSLSSGGSIVHPAVSSLLLTPICPRSLSFRPLVLPIDCVVTLRLSERNRSREVEVSVDGKRWGGLRVGDEMRVWGERMETGAEGSSERWIGGIPCIKFGSRAEQDSDGWVGGLNGLLKFNYPFGEEEE